jgi:membrane fusion protein (multidrug efflux system)
MTTLYSSDPMWVYFAIDESKLVALQQKLQHPPAGAQNAEAPFHIRFADGGEYRFPGHLDFVDAAVDEKTGTLQARISVSNPDRVLRPGLFVRVTVPAVREANAIVIPQQAVQEQQGLKSVFVVDAAGKVQPRQIVAGQRAGQSWIVDSGLQPGDQVVVEGVGKLRPGQQVKATLAEESGVPTAQDRPTRQSATPASARSGAVAAEVVRR